MVEFDAVIILSVLIGVVGGALSIAAILRLTSQRGVGFFQYFPYPILISVAALVFFSGRNLTLSYATQTDLLTQTNPASLWTSRACSAFLVISSLACIAVNLFRRDRQSSGAAPHVLLVAFVLFWCTTVASPALLGAHGSFAHDYLYALFMGSAAILLTARESRAAVIAARNGLVGFMIVSLVLLPLRPTLVTDSSYATGFFHGIPRLAGLAPHSVSLGMLALLAVLCLAAYPVLNRPVNTASWILALTTLFMAQSKTSWVSLPLCLGCVFWMKNDPMVSIRNSRRLLVRVILAAILIVVVGAALAYIFGSLGAAIHSSLSGQEGADLTSLTGRDRIWAEALADWSRHPLFGYGTDLFNEAYRTDINMVYAANGHNEFIDTLARSGIVGAVGLVVYVACLAILAWKYRRASRGLSIALFLAIALHSVSEVPLALTGYGPEALQHFLLIAVLAGQARAHSLMAISPPGANLLNDVGTRRIHQRGLPNDLL